MGSRKYFIFTSMMFFALAFGATLRANEIHLNATVNRTTIGVNDPLNFQLVMTGNTRSLPDVDLPTFDNFRIISGPSQSTQFSMVNGKISVSKTYSLTLLPRRTGKLIIPPVVVKHNGKTYASQPIVITVLQNSPHVSNNKATEDDNSEDLFIRTELSKNKVYVGDQVNVSFKVYFRKSIRNPDFVKLPETVGFWVEEFEVPQNIPVSQEVFNGRQYSVAEVKKMALFPTKPGKLQITPLQMSVDVVERRQRRDPFSVFDDFFDDPLGRTVRKVIASKPITIEVLPLPEAGKPANFSGLVGNLNMTVSIDKTDVETNEAITYKIKLSGTGNLKTLNDLPVKFPPSFEVFNPKISDDVNRRSATLYFTREIEYVLIPRAPGSFRIEPLEVSFFDPTTNKYRTLRSQEYLVEVRKGDQLSGLNTGNFTKSEVTLLGNDIHFIKESLPTLQPINSKPYTASWFYASLTLPLLALAAALAYRRHLDKLQTNVAYARKRKAGKLAEKRLKKARELMKQNNYEAFYSEIARALLGYIADKSNQSASGLMREHVATLLAERQVDNELVQRLLKCLDESDFRRFAPAQATPQAAQQIYDEAAAILDRLSKYL
jgi:hypothetical protein